MRSMVARTSESADGAQRSSRGTNSDRNLTPDGVQRIAYRHVAGVPMVAHATGTIADMPRRSASPGPPPAADDVPELTNGDLARIFHDIGDMLEVKGELVFKTVAYHRAADAIGRSPVDLVAAYRAGTPPRIPGVGQAISDKIAELATTGHLAFYDRLAAEVPPGLIELLRIPGLGPKTARLLYAELGIDSMDDLRKAAEAGTLRNLKGLSVRTEQLIIEGIDRLESTPQRHAPRPGRGDGVGPDRGAAGHPRRPRPGASRFLPAEPGDPSATWTSSPRRTTGPALIERFTTLGAVDQVINKGGYKAAIRLLRGPQVDLMVMPPGEAGTYRIHFTGSKEHNVRLRARARDQGWWLSEKGFLRIGEDGEPLTGDAAELRTFATEEEAYAFLGLPFIEPELREDAGEIEAALAGTLPTLVTLADLRGDLHSHSDWSDGVHASR